MQSAVDPGRLVDDDLALARLHGLDPVWITCDPTHLAPRSCELAGAVLDGTVDVPPDTDLYRDGEHRKCVTESIGKPARALRQLALDPDSQRCE